MGAKSLLLTGCLASLALAIEPPRNPWQSTGNGERLLSYNETTPSARLRPSSTSVRWASSGEDGEYITSNDNGDLVFVDIASGDSSVFLSADALPEGTYDYWIGAGEERVLVAANYTKQYRYSYFADYYIIDVASGESVPLVADQAGDIQYAEMAPSGDAIAFVRGNDLYIRTGEGVSEGTITRITEDGGPDMFNGVPDWVYEEEIFGLRGTLWWSPDATKVAYLSFNETGVDTFTIAYYMDNQKFAPVYPAELDLRYPKVGTKNPTVALNVLDVESSEITNVPVDAFEPENLIIGEVAWVTDTHSAVIYRAFNREQNLEKLVVYHPESDSAKMVRERDGSDGWLDNNLAISYVGTIGKSARSAAASNGKKPCNNGTYYVDLSDESGWMHLYLHSVSGGEPTQLTSGEWEVTSILRVDAERGLIYFVGTKQHSTEGHLYSVSYLTGKMTPLVDDTVPAVWSASFSSGGGYYILSYAGPDVPYQELYSVNSSSDPLRTLVDNSAFYEDVIDEYKLPNISYFELEHPDGYSLNVMEMLPPNFDPSKKYPVLFTPYGGPGSVSVSKTFKRYEWESYISSDPELEFITYTVDNRGCGRKGREFRSLVSRQLGKLEAIDQIWAAETLSEQNEFIDREHIGHWGWSYGGYLTAKVVERDAGVFTLGLITAPVSDWRFYDSMYTERYMGLYEDNEAGYNETAVRNVDGFKNIEGGFAIMHGTGDDNVHYQHTAALVDLLVGEGVTPDKMKMFAFTDSDHGIYYNGADVYIYKFLTARLWDELQRKAGGGLAHQWSKKKVTVA
jgi:dipeptidyl-peptidase-4